MNLAYLKFQPLAFASCFKVFAQQRNILDQRMRGEGLQEKFHVSREVDSPKSENKQKIWVIQGESSLKLGR